MTFKSKIPFLLVIFLFLSAFGVSAQKKDAQPTPEAVKAALKKQHPEAKLKEWKYSKKNNRYEAACQMAGDKYTASFSPDGKWLKTERNIKKGDVPKPVIAAFSKSKYASWIIDDVEEHQTPEFKMAYLIKIKNGKQEVKLLYLPDGNLVETKVKK